jgi:hypothetical protein
MLPLSRARLLSQARLLRGQGGVDDTDQQWMLDEWIQYVSDPASRIIDPPSLGQHFGDLLPRSLKSATLDGSMVALEPSMGRSWRASPPMRQQRPSCPPQRTTAKRAPVAYTASPWAIATSSRR